MRDPVIVSAARTAVGKANRGSLVHVRPDDMGGVVLKAAVDRAGIDPLLIEECIMGCAMPEAEQGMNVARQAIHCGGLPDEIPAMTINRYCCSGLQSIWMVCTDIIAGGIDIGLAGGTETMSMIPMGGNKIVPNIKMAETFPQAYVGMGETAENVAMKYGVSRQEQDEFAVESNRRAIEANKNGVFKEQIVPLPAYRFDGKGKKIEFSFEADEGPRASTVKGISGLRPAFTNPRSKTPEKLRDGSAVHENGTAGTVTAANASQMSDGAGAVLVMEKAKAEELGCTPMAKLVGYSVVGFDPDYMGIGPALAIPRVIEKFGKAAGITLDDVDVFEVNEAFASQAIYCVKELGNPNCGVRALGHPLGATGAKLSTQIIYHMIDNNLRYGIVSMCIGGGMGAAGLFENLQYKG
jgi:acetyl-CoA acyltransferase